MVQWISFMPCNWRGSSNQRLEMLCSLSGLQRRFAGPDPTLRRQRFAVHGLLGAPLCRADLWCEDIMMMRAQGLGRKPEPPLPAGTAWGPISFNSLRRTQSKISGAGAVLRDVGSSNLGQISRLRHEHEPRGLLPPVWKRHCFGAASFVTSSLQASLSGCNVVGLANARRCSTLTGPTAVVSCENSATHAAAASGPADT
jgi:hypothetical protein